MDSCDVFPKDGTDIRNAWFHCFPNGDKHNRSKKKNSVILQERK